MDPEPSSSSPRAPAHTAVRARARVEQQAGPFYEELQNEDGSLNVSAVGALLKKLDLKDSDYTQVVQTVAGSQALTLSREQAMAVVGFIASSTALAMSNSSLSLGGAGPQGVSKAPFRGILSKNRSYMETGSLSYDEAVMEYLAKLDAHRKKCEGDGRYAEARAAALRLADLKTAQVERLRQELLGNQTKELEEVQKVYEEEMAKFKVLWDQRVTEYEEHFMRAVEDIRGLQEQQRKHYVEELLRKKPFKPKPSREYLNQKKIEKSLAKNQQYIQAGRVKEAADELYAAEVQQTQQAYEAEQRLRIAKYNTKQKQEFEALLQRGARGRDELELRRMAETEKRLYRYRNVVSELQTIHKHEIVQLEQFLDAQVAAGKAVPLPGDAFRRKRELLDAAMF